MDCGHKQAQPFEESYKNKKRSNSAITRFPNKKAHGLRKYVLELSTNIHEMKKEKTRLAKILVPTVIIEDRCLLLAPFVLQCMLSSVPYTRQ